MRNLNLARAQKGWYWHYSTNGKTLCGKKLTASWKETRTDTLRGKDALAWGAICHVCTNAANKRGEGDG